MLLLCAQILIMVSASVEKAPNAPYVGPFGNMAKLRYVLGFFSRYVHPNWKRSTQRKHSSLLPLDWHPTSLCRDVVNFSLFNGGGQIFNWKSTKLTVKIFVKQFHIPFLIYERQPNQAQPQFLMLPTCFITTYSACLSLTKTGGTQIFVSIIGLLSLTSGSLVIFFCSKLIKLYSFSVVQFPQKIDWLW